MQQRDAFRITQPGTSLDSHLWIIISDPSAYPTEVFSLNVSKLRDTSDRACVLQPEDHSWIHVPSCIYYAKPKVFAIAELDKLCAANFLTMEDPFSEAVFGRIVEGATRSNSIDMQHLQLLERQGMIDT